MKLKDKAYLLISERRQFFLFHAAYVSTVYNYPTRISSVKSTYYLKKSGFSCTARTYNTHDFTFVNIQVYAFQHLKLSKTFRYSFYLYHISGMFRFSLSHIQPDNTRTPPAYSSQCL